MSVPPNSPVPPDSGGNNPGQAPYGGSAPAAGNSFWDSDTNRLIAIVGGILVACLLLAGISLTAAVGAKALSDSSEPRNKMKRSNPHGVDPRGPGGMGKRGFGGPDDPGDDGGLGALGGLGGLRGSLDLFSKFQHGDVVVTGANGQPETKRIARGAISAVTTTAVSIKSTDGFVSTYTIAPTTKVTVDGKASAVTGLTAGQNAFAMGTVVGAAVTADQVVVTPAQP